MAHKHGDGGATEVVMVVNGGWPSCSAHMAPPRRTVDWGEYVDQWLKYKIYGGW
jgi:hypothetical protein